MNRRTAFALAAMSLTAALAADPPVSLIFSFARTPTGWDLSRIQNR